MIKIKSCALFSLAMLFLSTPLLAQHRNSVYSMFGVGQIIDDCYGVNKSLGGTGIAFHSGTTINYLNPASYTGILPSSFLMETGVYGIYSRSESQSTQQTDGNINVSFFSSSIFLTNNWAMNFGIVPFSSVEYKVRYDDTIEGDPGTVEKTFTGNGGLNRVYLGNSIRLYKGLAVGFNAGFIFGPITQTESAEDNGNFSGYELTNNRTAYGFYMDYGLQYSLAMASRTYTIGLIYGASRDLDSSDELVFSYDSNVHPLDAGVITDLKVPQKFGGGIAVEGSRYRAGFDYQWQQWSGINFTDRYTDTRNSSRYSLGLELTPDVQNKNSWLGSLTYRLGASYKNTYLELENTPIDAATVNVGIGFPWNKINSVNLSVEYGKEGTTNNGLVQNSYWAVYLNFAMHQFWNVHAR